MTTLPASLRALVAGLGLATGIAAQTDIALTGIGPGRGLVVHGEGGIQSTPPFDVGVGSLGAASALLDLNGDGFDDLAIGAPDLSFFPASAGNDGSGHVYVVFGSLTAGNPASGAKRDLLVDKCSSALNLRGSPGDRAGATLTSAGDLDGDGFEDLLIGVPGHTEPGRADAGGGYVLWGAADLGDVPGTLAAPDCALNLAELEGTRATLFLGAEAFAACGSAVAGELDHDGDGTHDIALGAPFESTGSHLQNGTARVVYGKPGWKGQALVDLASLGSGDTTLIEGADDFQLLGWALASLGAFDATLPDGLGSDLVSGDDLAIGAPGDAAGGFFAGAVYTLRGRAGSLPPTRYDTSDFGNGAGSAGLVFVGENAGDQAGSQLGSAGDLVGADGFSELLIGAPFHDPMGRQDAGALYILAGRLGGSDPVGFDLGDIGSGALGLRCSGPTANAGIVGLLGAPAGDLDQDGQLDLAVGLPGSTVTVGGVPFPQAGVVEILDGNLLQIPAVETVDLAAVAGTLRLARLTGGAPSDRAGASLAAGDLNGDGLMDLAAGAPGAASDLLAGDLTGLANSETGRGHLFFGPLLRAGALSPVETHFQGPTVTLEIYNLTDATGLDVQVDGQSATLQSVVTGTPGSVVFSAPAPLAPGAGATVDVDIVLPGATVDLAQALTYRPFAVTSGPEPVEVVPGFEIAFTADAVCALANLDVTIGGNPATVLAADPLAGTFSVEAPGGLVAFTPYDVSIQTPNGDDLLTDAITYQPFVVGEPTPASGPQDAGVFVASLPFQGQPDVEVTLIMTTVSGTIPAETTVEFGSDEQGWHMAEIVSSVGDELVVNLPSFFFGPVETVVDVRITTNEDSVVLADAFTYEASDYTELTGTAQGAYGDPPRLRMSGDFVPSSTQLMLVDSFPPETFALYGVVGIALLEPPLFANGGLLAVDPLFPLFIPPAALPGNVFAINLNTAPNLGPEGAEIFIQVISVEDSGGIKDFGFGDVLVLTVRFP